MLTWLYSSVLKFRNYSYDNKIFKIHQVTKPVISIGNLTVGGTGKTPIVDHLLYWTRAKGIKAGVVSRGYGGSYDGVKKVPLTADPNIYGDEPCMLAMRNIDTPIYVCADRVHAANTLIGNEKVDVVIADDAFQHRRLYRDLDIVVVDLLEPKENYSSLPFGRAREPIQSMKRADVIILNKANLVTEQQVKLIKDFLLPFCRQDCMFIQGEYRAGKIQTIFGELKDGSSNF
ncbi:MAG: tetraacyldisaccharide 4'-kinase, partial [Bdellovibrionales bacterium]|nr:tetraacyldisaccharide 4'-kinase [Bdellovibrionales bacterium]